MIIELLIRGLVTIVVFVVEALPSWDVPPALESISDQASDVGVMASKVSAWVPWSVVSASGVIVLGTFTFVYGIRVALWLYAKVPWVGKSD